jgi:HK97 gp10 family phage protein
MNARIQGIVEARRAFARIDPELREAINDAHETTVREIARAASHRVRKRSGLLSRSIAFSVDKRRGSAKVGVKSGPAFYGHFVEFGTVRMAERPFMIPSVEAERDAHERRLKDAGRVLEKSMASVGGRFV